MLRKGFLLDCVDGVSALVLLGSGDEPEQISRVKVNVLNACKDESLAADVDVDMSHLPEDQRWMAQQLLNEERDVFCMGKEDHGACLDLLLNLNLSDNIPVVIPHRQILPPLYDEVKNFLNDLIANDWVRESNWCCSSPIVCVRKKDGGFSLCNDYPALNRKIIQA